MALKEHENNIITKEYNDPITNYLRNIIQRYFQIENEISQESKEAIIIQAYTRLKEILNAYTTKYIICINERSGNVDLSIKDFGGEERFDKNTAFNKDFCNVTTETKTLWNNTDETYSNFGEAQEDHIVSGDDDRLSDARIPLMHIHTIDDVNGLRELLDEYNLIKGFHLHKNQKVLNMLIYAGTRTSIDLLLVEDLVSKVEKAVERFKDTDIYFTTTAQHYINQLQDIFAPIYDKLKYIDDNIDSWISNFVPDANIYTDIQNVSFKNYIRTVLKDYLSNEEYNILKDTLEHSIKIINEGAISVANKKFLYDKLDSICTDESSAVQYYETLFNIKKGYTNISLSCVCTEQVPNNILQKLVNQSLLNGNVNVFLKYTKNNIQYEDLLPHIYQVNNRNHDFIYVYYNTDSNNNINVCFKRLTYIPIYIHNTLVVNAYSVDLSGKDSGTGYLTLDSTNNNIKTNNEVQDDNTVRQSDSLTDTFVIDNTNKNITFQVNAYTDGKPYCNKCRLNWSLDNDTTHTYKIMKRINGIGPWTSLISSTSFSSSDTAVLRRVYNEGHVYQAKTELFNNDKVQVWMVDENNCIVTSVNSFTFDMLLTNETYTVYRHRATLTATKICDGDWWDNDILGVIISAVNVGGRIHTLSVLCSGGDDSTDTGNVWSDFGNKCKLVYNFGQNDMQVLADGGSLGGDFEWKPDRKVNLDIRKDKKNILVYRSNMYLLDGYTNYDETQTSSTPCITKSLESIKAATGIDFSDGMIGYCDISQQYGTVVGINFETYNNYIGTEYIDDINDISSPKIPTITGHCLSKTEDEETYDITFDYSDTYEKVEYKLQVHDSIDWERDSLAGVTNKQNNPLYETNTLYVTSFSGINSFHWNVGIVNGDFANNEIYTLLSEENLDNKKHIVLKVSRSLFADKLIFCDNTYEHANRRDDLLEFLEPYGCTLASVNDDASKKYCASIILPQNKPIGNLQYHVNGSDFTYFDGNDTYTDNDMKNNYFGQYNFGSLIDFFPNIQLSYQLLVIPGKGEDNA